jgi:endonuclease YncB( thermonuclease family)
MTHLQGLLRGQAVLVRCSKNDGNGRHVCDVFVDDRDIGLEMVEAGLAWHFKRFENEQSADARKRYAEAEDDARRARRGLWSFEDPMPPWTCRRVRREGGQCQ